MAHSDPYWYAGAAGYTRGRTLWTDLPDTSTPALAELSGNRWDQAIYDLKRLTFNERDYGTGANSASIQAAADAAHNAGGGIVFLPRLAYTIDTPITSYANVAYDGLGKGFTVLDSSSLGAASAFTVAGAVATAKNLTVSAARGDTSLTVASTTGIVADDWVKVFSTDSFGSDNQPRGEIVRVLSVTSTVLSLCTPLCDSYPTSATGQVQKIAQAENIGLRGLTIRGPADTTVAQKGFDCTYARNVLLRDVGFERTHYIGAFLSDVWDFHVDSCTFKDIMLTGLAYGVSIAWACQDGRVTGCYGERMRHFVTHGGGAAKAGLVRRITIEGNNAITLDASIDSHASSEYLTIRGNTCIISPETGGATDHDGIIVQGTRCTIQGNEVYLPVSGGGQCIVFQPSVNEAAIASISGNNVRGGNYGIVVAGVAGYSNYGGVSIQGNTVEDVAFFGIYGDGQVQAISRLTIGGNVVRGCGSDSIELLNCDDSSVSDGNIIEASNGKSAVVVNSSDNCVVDGGNIIVGAAGASFGVRTVAATDCTVEGNRIRGVTTGVSFDSSTTNSTVQGNNLRGNTTPHSLSTGSGNTTYNNKGVTTLATIASAATITLVASENDIFLISGTADITSITAADAGRRITLKFASTAATNGVVDGSNLKLNGNLAYTADDTLTLVCDGTNWYETARSVN